MTARATTRCYVESTGIIPARRGEQRIITNGLPKQMSDAPQDSVKRDADRFRPLKSRRQISLPLIRELGQLELTVLLLLVLAADVIVATVFWFVVGSLLR
jgi:hypothetical protein